MNQPRTRRRFAVRLGVSLGIAAVFVWMLERESLHVVPAASAFRGLRIWAVPVYAALLVCVHFLRAFRWRHLLAPVGRVPGPRLVAVAWVGFAAIMILPLRLGELVRPLLVADRRISRPAAFGTIAAERVLDGVVVSLVLAAGLLSTPNAPAWIRATGWATLAAFGAALALSYLFVAGRASARALVERTAGLVSQRVGLRAGGWVEGLAAGLGALPDGRIMARFLVETCAYWGLNGLAMWLLARGVGLDLSVLGAFTTMAVLAVGILLPTGPGFFGSFQYAVFLALGLYLDDAIVRGPGAGFVFVLYATQLALTVILAMVALLGGHVDVREAGAALLPDGSGEASPDSAEKLPKVASDR